MVKLLEDFTEYSHLNIIGRGAFSVVYKAIDREHYRTVALKILQEDHLENEEWKNRFQREIQLLQRLNHRSIISIYDSGIFEFEERSSRYLALEYVRGINLKDYVASFGRLPWQEVFKIVYQILDAVNYMHLNGVLHRDLKPANIMYNLQDEVAKIIDFGLGKCLKNEDVDFTKRDLILGTPNYMPVEQWCGLAKTNEKSDIYSLGATAYYLLSGELPFGSDESTTNLFLNIYNRKLTPLEKLCEPETPKIFIHIIKKMMAYNPEDRYANLQKLLTTMEKEALQYHISL